MAVFFSIKSFRGQMAKSALDNYVAYKGVRSVKWNSSCHFLVLYQTDSIHFMRTVKLSKIAVIYLGKIAESAPLQRSILSLVTGCRTIMDIRFRTESNGRTCNTSNSTIPSPTNYFVFYYFLSLKM